MGFIWLRVHQHHHILLQLIQILNRIIAHQGKIGVPLRNLIKLIDFIHYFLIASLD